ncbi:xanthine dehydrogenase family protein subunit M [Chloroflexota bacterium]|nr:xanthine dehydrogenase family protein subunit M [Chloroflexota bacterium]
METFKYYKPRSIQDAFNIIQQEGGSIRFLAGGTDLLARLKSGHFAPDIVVDLKSLDELNGGIRIVGQNVHIGALTTFAKISTDPVILEHFPALADAASEVGSVQIRNRATIGGNICNASPAGDSLPPLFIYGAKIKCLKMDSSRLIPVESFLQGPGKTVLEKGELLVGLVLPLPATNQAASFTRLTRRRGADLATINLCCQVFRNGPTRFAVGAAAPVPFIVEDPSGLLSDPAGDPAQKKALVEELMQAASPITDVRASKEYRRAMVVTLALRALKQSINSLEGQAS